MSDAPEIDFTEVLTDEQAQRVLAVSAAREAVVFKQTTGGFGSQPSLSVDVDELLRVAEFIYSGTHIDHDFEIVVDPA